MSEADIRYRVISPCSEEQDGLLPLLGRCLPVPWGGRKPPFHYAGTSFVAEAGGEFVGHAAIMRIEIETGDGAVVPVGGLASVGVDPNYRGHGIAEKLCRMAQEHFRAEGFAMLTLYTALYRVYEKSGWRRYDNADLPWTIRQQTAPVRVQSGVAGPELSEAMREHVVGSKLNGATFPGKARRYEGPRVSHSWKRLFSRKGLRFYLSAQGYAACDDGVLEELYAPAEERRELLEAALAENDGKLTVAVPPQCLAKSEAQSLGFAVSDKAEIDPMHGESPMIYTFDNGRCPALEAAIRDRRFFFPSIDKF